MLLCAMLAPNKNVTAFHEFVSLISLEFIIFTMTALNYPLVSYYGALLCTSFVVAVVEIICAHGLKMVENFKHEPQNLGRTHCSQLSDSPSHE